MGTSKASKRKADNIMVILLNLVTVTCVSQLKAVLHMTNFSGKRTAWITASAATDQSLQRLAQQIASLKIVRVLDITIEGKSLLWKNWTENGIYYIQDILNENGTDSLLMKNLTASTK